MNKTLKVIAAAVFALAAVSAMAQGGGGRGQGGGMRGMMGGGGDLQLLQRKDVQADLKITADQQKKLEAIQEEQRQVMQQRMEEMRNGGGGGDREAMMAEFRKMNEAMNAKVKEVLTADQQKRLKEIGIQLAGNRAVMREDVQKELGLTADQKKKIDDLNAQMQAANQAIMQRVRDQEITREEVQPLMQKNNEALSNEIGKVLTQEQKDKLKAMGGAPFKADPNERGRGGFGG